ncbi:MAG TPA: amidohydrolase family protein [Thermoanaerobaculia bacterium]|nr:amidohydrolase family protein [Thermoanaerobaculia bacterium]
MSLRAALAALVLAAAALPAHGQNADFVWYGGPILAANGRPEALAVKDGRIVAIGTRAEVERKWKGRLTLPIDLFGQALVAGLVTPPAPPPAKRPAPRIEKSEKSKPPSAPRKAPAPVRPPPPPPAPPGPPPPLEALAADVSPPPDGIPYTIPEIRDALRMWILRSSLPRRHRIVLGFGYDATKLAEGRPPTREELDTVSATLPVIVVSRSGTEGAYNTIALQRAGISWRTKDPPGGVIRRRGRIFEPSGVLEGTAHARAFAKLVPRMSDAERIRLLAESRRIAAPEEPEPEPERVAAAAPAPPPVRTPPPAPAPTPAPAPAVAAVSSAPPPAPRDAGSEALAALVANVLAGRAVLEVGAPADMSVLSDDPAAVGPEKRGTLQVVEEVRRGRTVWRRDRPRG